MLPSLAIQYVLCCMPDPNSILAAMCEKSQLLVQEYSQKRHIHRYSF